MKQNHPHPTRAAVKVRKHHEAETRAFARSKVTAKGQLAKLDNRPGEAKAERARLLETLTKTPPAKR